MSNGVKNATIFGSGVVVGSVGLVAAIGYIPPVRRVFSSFVAGVIMFGTNESEDFRNKMETIAKSYLRVCDEKRRKN